MSSSRDYASDNFDLIEGHDLTEQRPGVWVTYIDAVVTPSFKTNIVNLLYASVVVTAALSIYRGRWKCRTCKGKAEN